MFGIRPLAHALPCPVAVADPVLGWSAAAQSSSGSSAALGEPLCFEECLLSHCDGAEAIRNACGETPNAPRFFFQPMTCPNDVKY